MKLQLKENNLDTGEVLIHYLAGPDNGPPLVLIPGQGLSLESYQRVMTPLAEELSGFCSRRARSRKIRLDNRQKSFPEYGK
ncbi:alpha/beta fold hydrolase [Dehalococcoides mccartyi]|uniref:alpha/beta fold hydrolase n=1 Tax=Dehalococcoides mccartyi TaxID=61435 RepID=UPI000A5C3932|nr:alpha/beta hydrolase [Dehalococcoides mccartyi]BEL01168.1 hypothetical protein DMOBY_10210 [Dehalococcoides mccartyi]